MLGRILLYQIEEGKGLILTQDNQKYPFEVDVWTDFDNMPNSGMKIEFQLLNGKVATMKRSKDDDSSSDEEDIKLPLREEDPEDAAFKSIKIEELSASSVAQGTMDKSLDMFFTDLTNTVVKYQHRSSKEEKHQLNYFAIKRFLYTAYNMLREMDTGLVDLPLVNLLENLREISRVYELYKRSKQQPKIAFQNIFLKFTKYKEAKCRLEYNIEEMGRLRFKAEKLSAEIKQKTAILQKVDKSNPKLPDAVALLKKMKKLYVDMIDNIGTLREENEKLVPITNEYYDRFFDDFVSKFNQSYELNMKVLKEILDSLAYTFDQSMWIKAKDSKVIQHYFEESNIDGDFSTLTFLKYYLRSLDQTKMSQEHQALFKLKEYLEKKQRGTN